MNSRLKTALLMGLFAGIYGATTSYLKTPPPAKEEPAAARGNSMDDLFESDNLQATKALAAQQAASK